MRLTGYGAKGINKAVNAAGTLGGYVLPTEIVGADNKNKALTTMAEKKGQIAEKLTSLKESKVGQYASKAYNAAGRAQVKHEIDKLDKEIKKYEGMLATSGRKGAKYNVTHFDEY